MVDEEGGGQVGIPKGFPRLRSKRLFHSPSSPRLFSRQRHSFRRIAAHGVRPVADATSSVPMFLDRHPASVARQGVFSICQQRFSRRTVLSWFTTRSCGIEKMRSRSPRTPGRKALPGSAAGTAKRRLNSAT